MRRAAGFTLIELVVVIVLIGIIGVAVSGFISGPIRAYVDQSRRAALVDAADTSLRRIAREIRLALPNSIDAASPNQLELIPVLSGGRYRDEPIPGPADDDAWLDFSKADTGFGLSVPFVGLDALLPIGPTDDYRLVIYNDGAALADAYAGDGVISPDGKTVTVSAADRVTLEAPGHQFSYRSPSKRVFLVEQPVTVLCDLGAGTLSLVTGYGWTRPPVLAGGSSAILARDVEDCRFTYQPGASQRAGVVTLELTLERDGERVRLFHQVQVVNVP